MGDGFIPGDVVAKVNDDAVSMSVYKMSKRGRVITCHYECGNDIKTEKFFAKDLRLIDRGRSRVFPRCVDENKRHLYLALMERERRVRNAECSNGCAQ